MTDLNHFLESLTALADAHREALSWFHDHRNQEVSWPSPRPGGMFLVNKAKGIHKPAGSAYALSVRESLGGPYPDREPIYAADGSWTYRYFQEQPDPDKRDSIFTNRALLACQRDRIPVGVIRQVKAKPNPRYKVLGLAFVGSWEDGYFNLLGLPPDGPNASYSWALSEVETAGPDDPEFSPASLEDARQRIHTEIVRRQGQGKFRSMVLSAYGGRCAISGCDVVQAVEAAHIVPYIGAKTNVVTNGLPLRADLHTLYDLGLIAIDPETMQVVVSPKLLGTSYASLANQPLRLPEHRAHFPSRLALARHLAWASEQ